MINAKPLILYDNRFADGTPTATDTASEYDVLNIIDWKDFTFWQAASVGTKYLTINCGSAKVASALAILGHNYYMGSATISVESSVNGSAWTARLVGFIPA